jgi:hypothetical protein
MTIRRMMMASSSDSIAVRDDGEPRLGRGTFHLPI